MDALRLLRYSARQTAHASGQLVELYGDGATLPMGWAAAPLRLLVREAVSPPGPSA